MRAKRQALIEVDHTSISKEIGSRLRSIRQEKGLSQLDVAKMLGLSFQQVQKYEQGKDSISVSRLLQISIAFNVTLNDIIDGIMPSNEPIAQLATSRLCALRSS